MVKQELQKNMVSLKIRLTSGSESFSLKIMGENIEDAIEFMWILQQASLAQPGGLFVMFEMDDSVRRQLKMFAAGLSDDEYSRLHAVAEETGFVFSNSKNLLEIVAKLRDRFPDRLRVC